MKCKIVVFSGVAFNGFDQAGIRLIRNSTCYVSVNAYQGTEKDSKVFGAFRSKGRKACL